MTRILVTGASGLLGSNLILHAQQSGLTVIASSHARPIDHAGILWMPADMTDPGAVTHLMEAAEPNWVVNCAAATDVDLCEEDSDWAFSLNHIAAGQVAAAARDHHAHLVHISTDAVFGGGGGPYTEADRARPVNAYGESKLAGEAAVFDAFPEAAIVRTNFYGWSPAGRHSLAEFFLASLNDGERPNGFEDVLVNPLLVNDLTEILLHLLSKSAGGIFHAGADDCMSKYEFGQSLAHIYGLDASAIQPMSVDAAELGAPRPKRLCLVVQKIERELGIEMQSIGDGLQRMVALDRDGYRMRVAGLLGNSRKVSG